MRDYVIDANILISILISGKASYKPLLRHYNFILPDFSLVEVEKYRNVLIEKSRLKDEEFLQWSYFVFNELTILPAYVLNQRGISKAVDLLSAIDLKDIAYLALSVQLELVLLTRDKPLYRGLKKQGFRKVMLFEDFISNQ